MTAAAALAAGGWFSWQMAVAAQEAGWFAGEITPVQRAETFELEGYKPRALRLIQRALQPDLALDAVHATILRLAVGAVFRMDSSMPQAHDHFR